MTEAQHWGKKLHDIPVINGFCDRLQWQQTVTAALNAAVKTRVAFPDTDGQSVYALYADGSVLYVGNPTQEKYTGFVLY